MNPAIRDWMYNILEQRSVVYRDYLGSILLTNEFTDFLRVQFREVFPYLWSDFFQYISGNTDRFCNILALILQNFAYQSEAEALENILSLGGSAYEVVKENKTAPEFTLGAYNLAHRVPTVVKESSRAALNENSLLNEAWNLCYQRSPDYKEVVSRCNDFLEGFLRDNFWPSEEKTKSIDLAIKELEKNPSVLKFKGDSFLDDKTKLVGLLKGISIIRGEHTTGKGRKPTRDEAVYVLHTTIYIWNLIRKE